MNGNFCQTGETDFGRHKFSKTNVLSAAHSRQQVDLYPFLMETEKLEKKKVINRFLLLSCAGLGKIC
jgi:hypothetical protein